MNARAARIADHLRPLVGLVLVVVVFTIWGAIEKPGSTFFTAARATLIAKHSAIVGLGALGMTVVIVAGGIDLSAGAFLALGSVVLALLVQAGVDPLVAVGLTLASGAACGLVNGLVVTKLRLAPFIATLGTMLVFRGVAELLADQRKIAVDGAPAWLAGLLSPPAPGSAQLVASGVWVVALAALALAFVLARTVFGRHVFAIGSNEAAARACGIRVERTKLAVYAIGGVTSAGAAVLCFAELAAQGDPTAGNGKELEMVAAAVIGGASLSGGRGSVGGALLGALLVATLRAGCTYVEASTPVQNVATGLFIVAAVALDRRRAR